MASTFSVTVINVPAALKEGRSPVDVFSCEPGPRWHVVRRPLVRPSENIRSDDVFSIAHGEFAEIPLFPYLVPWDPPLAMGFVAQLLFALTRMRPHATKLHLAVGTPLETVTDADRLASYRLWLGLAFAVPS